MAFHQVLHDEGVPQIRRDFADLRQNVVGGQRNLISGDLVPVDTNRNVSVIAGCLSCGIPCQRVAANQCGKQGDRSQIHVFFHLLPISFRVKLSRYDSIFKKLNAAQIRHF